MIRTAGTLAIGTGGALLLTARRQRYTDLALAHTDRDATERRITELKGLKGIEFRDTQFASRANFAGAQLYRW